jgi:multidrug efflux pump subunit AcrA (membrane-fusion protein)
MTPHDIPQRMTPDNTKPTRASQRRRRARTRRRRVAAGCGALVAVAIGIGVSRVSASGVPSYRTAVATTSSVSRTLAVSGTLEPVHQATVDFQASGTVASVDVKSGQKVTAGKVMAGLDTSTLTAAVSEAETTLASARAKLTENEENESSSSSASGKSSPASTASTSASTATVPTATAASSTASTASTATLAKEQKALVADQHTVDTDMETATGDLAEMKTACASAPASAPSTTSTTAATATGTGTGTGTDASGASSAACAKALTTAGSAETRQATDQQALSSAQTALAGILESEAKSAGSSSSDTAASPASSRSGSTAGSTPSSTSASVDTDTPKQLAADEAAIDSDEASLAEARQSLDGATLVSPISGTVEAVDMAAGDVVSSASSTYSVTVVDWGSYEVSAALTTTEAQKVAVGQEAQVTVDGVTGAMEGKVTRVGPVDDSDSSYTYPLIVTITSPAAKMAEGSQAHAEIDLENVNAALVVPTSAVHTSAAKDSYVELDKSGKEVRQNVTTGAVGDVYTQITSGLRLGEVVVLANPAEAVPSSSTNTTSTVRAPGGSAGAFAVTGGRFGGAGGGGGGGGSGGAPPGGAG